LKDKRLWKELIPLLSAEGQPTKAVSAQTYMGVFFIYSVCDTIFANAFSSETTLDLLVNCCGPPVVCRRQFEKHCYSL
jgi:hypothetical protein